MKTFILALLFPLIVFGADKKISELNSLGHASFATNDLLVIVDTGAGETKNTTLGDFDFRYFLKGTDVLPIASGGTNLSSIPAAGSFIYSNGSSFLTLGSTCTAGQVLQVNGSHVWACATPATGGTVNTILVGTGMTGGGSSSTVTVGVNSELQGLSGLSSLGVVKRTGSGTYTAAAVDLTADVTGILPTSNLPQSTTSTSGYLSSTDWNTFNGKQSALTLGNLTDTGTDGITVTGGTGSVVGSGTSLSQHVSDSTHAGYLSSSDWSTFNGKQAAGSYITALTGDATASGPGSAALTLATVNSNVGSFGSSTAIPSFTVNAKGLITAASTNAVIAPAGTLTGTTLASNVVTSSLTSVGTITSGVWNGTAVDVAHGGTGATSFTTGSIPFMGASTLEEDNTDLFWENTGKTLDIGTAGHFTQPLAISVTRSDTDAAGSAGGIQVEHNSSTTVDGGTVYLAAEFEEKTQVAAGKTDSGGAAGVVFNAYRNSGSPDDGHLGILAGIVGGTHQLTTGVDAVTDLLVGLYITTEAQSGAATLAADIYVTPSVYTGSTVTAPFGLYIAGADVGPKSNWISGSMQLGGISYSQTANTALDIQSTTGALAIPRMTTTQKNALTASNGMMVYDTTLGEFDCYTSSWGNCGSGGGGGANTALSNLASVQINTDLIWANSNSTHTIQTNDESSSTDSDSLQIKTGQTQNGNSGNILVGTGSVSGNGSPGTLQLIAGDGGNASGGGVTIQTGTSSSDQSGNMTILTAHGITSGGNISITGGDGDSTTGGSVSITGGNSSGGTGGSIHLSSGTGVSGSSIIQLTPGSGTTDHIQLDSLVYFNNSQNMIHQYAPLEQTLTASTVSPTAVAAYAWPDITYSVIKVEYTMFEKSTGHVKHGRATISQNPITSSEVDILDTTDVVNGSFPAVVLTAASTGGNVVLQFTNASTNDVLIQSQITLFPNNAGSL